MKQEPTHKLISFNREASSVDTIFATNIYLVILAGLKEMTNGNMYRSIILTRKFLNGVDNLVYTNDGC